MADIFREIDEAMRQDRAARFWKENAAYIVAFVLGTIVLTAALSGYRVWDARVKQEQTAVLIAFQDAPEYPDNVTPEAVAGLKPGLRGIALLSAAGRQAEKKKTDRSLSLYEAVAADGRIPQDFRHLATLMSVRLRSGEQAAGGAAEGQKLVSSLEPLWKNPASTWAAHARLEAAAITANVLNDPEAAQAHLNAVQDMTGLPATLYEKARALGHVYVLRAGKQPKNASTATDSKS